MLSVNAMVILRDSLNEALARNGCIVGPSDMDVFQLVGGRWIKLDGSTELVDAPIPEKVNFREFL
jgi:hypothetical protein